MIGSKTREYIGPIPEYWKLADMVSPDEDGWILRASCRVAECSKCHRRFMDAAGIYFCANCRTHNPTKAYFIKCLILPEEVQQPHFDRLKLRLQEFGEQLRRTEVPEFK